MKSDLTNMVRRHFAAVGAVPGTPVEIPQALQESIDQRFGKACMQEAAALQAEKRRDLQPQQIVLA